MAALVVLVVPHAAPAWRLKTLYSFCAQPHCNDGQYPNGPLIRDTAGNLFGTTTYGGYVAAYAQGGVVFELSPTRSAGWKYHAVYRFCADPPTCSDGYLPQGAVVIDTAGNLYGTTALNGPNAGGTAYELSPQSTGWALSTLYAFPSSGSPGANPAGGLTYSGASAGMPYDGTSSLFGVTLNGGEENDGAAYQLTPGSGRSVSEVYSFTGGFDDAASPNTSLTIDRFGVLYGISSHGGNRDVGTAFQLVPDGASWHEALLASFGVPPAYSYYPSGALLLDPSGALFGTNSYGGPRCHYMHHQERHCGGNIFSLSSSGNMWSVSSLHDFCLRKDCPDGATPAGSIVELASGVLLGTAVSGGEYGGGVIFSVRKNGSNFKLLHEFCGSDCIDGKEPSALLLGADGNIYGVTGAGGVYGGGTIFELSP